MYSANRKLNYCAALNEALHQMMAGDDDVILIGQGVKSPWYVGQTCLGLLERFGARRVMDTPVSENAVTGAAVGAAIVGMRPVVVHPRVDFLVYALDPLINEAANWHFMSGGRSRVPVVVWAIVNRGGQQAAQHSQSLHALFAHCPGLKVVMPSTAYDAKGLMIAAIRDNNPVVFMDDRWLYGDEDNVPEEIYEVPIGRGIIRRTGTDLTITASSFLAREAVKAADELENEGFHAEVIDLRSIKPLDEQIILESVRKTGRLLAVDGGWRSFGAAAEVAALAAEKAFDFLRAPVRRLCLPDVPAPASSVLEDAYYVRSSHVFEAARMILGRA